MVDPGGALSNVLAETNATGSITAYYVYGLGLISKITPASLAYYYHHDGIGSTVAVNDSSGNLVNKYAYDAFGKVLNQEEATPNPFKYVGRFGVMDEENGLLYMRARYYDPEVGRFINKDPIGLLSGPNVYAYTTNNAINKIDPSGLHSFYDCMRGCWDNMEAGWLWTLSCAIGGIICAAQPETCPSIWWICKGRDVIAFLVCAKECMEHRHKKACLLEPPTR